MLNDLIERINDRASRELRPGETWPEYLCRREREKMWRSRARKDTDQ